LPKAPPTEMRRRPLLRRPLQRSRHFALTDELIRTAGTQERLDPFIAGVNVQDTNRSFRLGSGTLEES
jgi:hypothetical protein